MPIETPARVAFLKKIHLFYGLEEADLQAVAEELDELHVPEDGVVFEQGGRADSFYLIYGGSVRITRKQDRKEIQLALLVKYDYFGEMGLVAKRPRSGTAIAVTDTSLLVLSRQDFEKLFKRAPQLRSNLDLAIRSRQLARKLQFKWLHPDEVIYFLARKHAIVLYQRLIWPILALVVPVFFFYGWYAIADFFVVGLAAWGSLLAIILWGIWLWVDWGNDYYIVTNERVLWLEKVIGIYESRQESPLSTILSVAVETSQLGRILDYGDVIVRTWVGRLPFDDVSHPEQARHMIEEYWNRTKEQAVGTEKEAMKDAIRKRLGIKPSPPAEPKTDSAKPVPPKRERMSVWRLLSASRLKLRYETGNIVVYRKHWFVLIQQAWMPLLAILGIVILFFSRLYRLALIPDEAFISFQNGMTVDTWALALIFSLFPAILWLIYQIMDWSNDIYEVTPEQIIDLDKKPFGTETRNAAQLEHILGTEYRRVGILGQIFNYGTVYITVGGSQLAFENVMDPATVQADIDRRREANMEKKRQAEIAAERERMAEWLVTYHKSADDFRREEEKKRDQNSG